MLNKILSFYTRYFAVWVVGLAVVAYFFPKPFSYLGYFKNWFFALTMFGIGAVLCADDFRHIIKNPVIILIGALAQFIIMPFGAFILARLFNLPAEVSAGLILAGAAPDAMAGNVMAYIAKADTAYAVSLTTVTTLSCPVLTPGLTWLLAKSRLSIQFWDMLLDLMLTVIIPLVLGFAARHFFKKQFEKILPVFPALSTTFIVFICALVVALNREFILQATGPILAAVVILNIGGMIGGYGVGAFFKMGIPQKRTLAIQVGMQNAALGTKLALDHIGPKAAIPTAFFIFVCIFTAALAAAFWQRSSASR
ncbi:MAG: bile acid:sodium symporter family protein [Sedimentisphaerales bacterium]